MILEVKNKDENILLEIAKLEKEIFPESFYSIEVLKDMSKKDEYIILSYGKDVKGYLLLHDSYDLYEIMKIGVKEKFRKNGLGKQLLEYYLNKFDKNLFLEVRESNKIARNFYENIGFVTVGKRKDYYENKETAILMSLERN